MLGKVFSFCAIAGLRDSVCCTLPCQSVVNEYLSRSEMTFNAVLIWSRSKADVLTSC